MKYLLTFILGISMLNAFSQNPADTLFEKLNSANDQEKVEIYLAIAKINWRLSTDSIYKYSNLAYDLAHIINYAEGEAKALSYIGVTFFYKAEYDSVLHYYDAAIEKFKEADNMAGAAISINNKGVLYKRLGNFSKSLECYNEAKKIHEENKDYRELGGTYLNIGNVYDIQNDFDRAMEYYFLALEQFEKIDDKIKIASALTNIGQIHSDLNQDSLALSYYEQAVVLQKEENDLYGMANTLANIGIQHKKLGNYSTSVDHFQESLELYKRMKDQDAIAWVYNNLGVVYGLMKDWDMAYDMYQKTEQITQKIGDVESLAYVKYDLAEMYFSKRDWNAARNDLKKGIEYGKSLNMIELLDKSYLLLSQIDSAQGKFLDALQSYKMHAQFKDSIFNQQSDRNISEIEAKYETAKKEQQITLLQKEKTFQELKLKKNKIIGIISVIGSFVFFTLILVWTRSNHRKREEKALLKNTMDTEDKERKRLAEELHDGVGPLLSTVKLYINEIDESTIKESEKELLMQSDKIIDEAINTARSLSHNLMPQDIEKDGLIKSLQVFTSRVCINQVPNIDIEPVKTNDMGLWQQVMLYRIITELLNNSLKYADAKQIKILFKRDKKNLILNYEDDGQGFDLEATLKKENGIGLKNVLSRVNSLKGDVNLNSSEGKGFKANIIIAIKHLIND
ncbi:MAG: tetratricopeptide repeat protein [Bacteroidetes bacterium]|nr:tetratricopeptide repeat protein [Bacteroidota bacterium]